MVWPGLFWSGLHGLVWSGLVDIATQHMNDLIGYHYDYDLIAMEKVMERTREEMDIMYKRVKENLSK